MNAGYQAQLMGLKGISNDSEEIIVARDIMLAKSTGARLHICHISTAGSVELVRQAKAKGLSVTAEATPHHFSLSDSAVVNYDANTKMNPPLRSRQDVEAIRLGLADGTIDAIATDHAPHALEDKQCEYDRAAFGIVGLETALPLGITHLIKTGILTESQFIAKLTSNPADIISDNRGSLGIGCPADITIIDPNIEYVIDTSKFLSKSKNSPFNGHKVCGQVLFTISEGVLVFKRQEDSICSQTDL